LFLGCLDIIFLNPKNVKSFSEKRKIFSKKDPRLKKAGTF